MPTMLSTGLKVCAMDIKLLQRHKPEENNCTTSRQLTPSERQTIADNMLSEQFDIPEGDNQTNG